MPSRKIHLRKAAKWKMKNLSKRCKKRAKISRGSIVWKSLKGIIFIFCLALFLYQATTFFLIYNEYPTTIKIEFTYPEEFEFPAVTFCSSFPIKRSKFCSEYPDLCETPENITEICEIDPSFCKGDPSNIAIPKRTNDSVLEVLDAIREVYLNDSEYQQDSISSYDLNIQKSESLDFFYPPTVYFSIHSPFVPVNPLSEGRELQLGHKYSIIIRMMCEELCFHDLFEPYKNMTPAFKMLEYPLELCLDWDCKTSPEDTEVLERCRRDCKGSCRNLKYVITVHESAVVSPKTGDLFSFIGGLMGCWLGVSIWAFAGIAENVFRRAIQWMEHIKRYFKEDLPAKHAVFSTNGNKELNIKITSKEVMTRFEGVRVTVESFMTWKAKFDQEMAELKKLQAKEEVASKKLTGRELFEKDKTLVDSDLKFLQDEGEVKVDESLFQELDDLELQEDEEDLLHK
ncbi:RWD domain-containing protein 1 [Argiope bruennichi]|uniref:RWD domain-containing protein 1 n=1 Tax=Argiope bruennichi TaxID=94029 RepID=A0A8T0ESL3_ARGBR|nr:RWD domain-containing protein 1 [Argiope bruennichi]